ncbi:MAG TPA: YihY/virulence factor BrkB family protein [Gemmatimonadales bacterium]|nr:YihY/virulence factor BrkB family protein [Gemmatimonadales bacterium]
MIREGGWHRSVPGIARRTLEASYEDNIAFLASGLSFDLLLTLIPFIFLLLAVLAYLVQHQITTQQISLHELLARLLPTMSDGGGADAFQGVEGALGAVLRKRGRLTLVGLPLFLWFSTRLFGGLRAALNDVFDTDESRPWPLAKSVDVFMVLVTGVFLIANGMLAAYEARNAGLLSQSFVIHWAWSLSMEVVAFALDILMFFIVFKLLPGRRINWRTALVASTFCSLGFEVTKRLYAMYVGRFVTFDRVASDANVAALLLFLLWVYYTCYLFLLSGEVAETFDLIRMRRAQETRLG